MDAATAQPLELRALNAELERRVLERAAQTEVAVSNLHAQISQRAQAERALRESEERYRRLAERSGVQLIVGEADGIVEADADRMVQVLTNLVSNAIKFSADGGQVKLSATTDVSKVRFSVADQGRGIPADKLEAIFDRFQQVDASDARVKGGAGLGLTICKSIVEQHGGRVWAESKLGHGSTFYVELPS